MPNSEEYARLIGALFDERMEQGATLPRFTPEAYSLIKRTLQAAFLDPGPNWTDPPGTVFEKMKLLIDQQTYSPKGPWLMEEKALRRLYRPISYFEVLHFLTSNLNRICPIEKDTDER